MSLHQSFFALLLSLIPHSGSLEQASFTFYLFFWCCICLSYLFFFLNLSSLLPCSSRPLKRAVYCHLAWSESMTNVTLSCPFTLCRVLHCVSALSTPNSRSLALSLTLFAFLLPLPLACTLSFSVHKLCCIGRLCLSALQHAPFMLECQNIGGGVCETEGLFIKNKREEVGLGEEHGGRDDTRME